MKKILTGATLALALGVSAIAAASSTAQYGNTAPDITPTDISLRLGAGFPFDNSLKSIASVWVAAGVDYQLKQPLIQGLDTYFSVDWLGRAANGAHGNLFPIMLNERLHLSKKVQGYDAYAFAGIGATVADITSTNTLLGIRGGLGVNIGEHYFAEATVYLSTGKDGVHGNIIGVYLGYRF